MAAIALCVAWMAVSCTSPPPPPRATGAGGTVDGRTVFVDRCARCHGAEGEGGIGPRLIGDDRLAGYGTALGLFDYVSQVMPADAPGTLPADQYWAVVAYLVRTGGYGDPPEPFDRDGAARVTLTRNVGESRGAAENP